MKRLIKKANEDEMSFEEIEQETFDAINNMRKTVNRWDVRDTLKQFTEWGFYNGDAMANIDEEIAINICDQLKQHVENANEDDVYDVYDIIYSYSR